MARRVRRRNRRRFRHVIPMHSRGFRSTLSKNYTPTEYKNIKHQYAQFLYAGFLPRGGLPEKLYTTFTYTDSWQLQDTGTAGVAQYWQGRLNSIFDPNFSNNGSNTQPYMRDEIVPFYSKAVIYGCAVELCAISDTAQTKPHVITMRPSLSASAPTDSLLEKERPRAVSKCLLAGSNGKVVFKKYYSMASLLGIKKSSLEDDTYAINIGSNATNTVYLNITQSPMPVPSSIATELVNYAIKMKYYVKLYGYVDQAAS